MKTLTFPSAFALFAFTLTLTLTSTAPARTETINCTASARLPATITVQGVYCLTGDLTTAITTGNAITVAANNVTIGLNGHKLGGPAAGLGTSATGIFVFDQTDITLKNGTVREFASGVYLQDTSSDFASGGGHVIEGLRADFNTRYAIHVDGSANIIRDNQVVSTGGSTLGGQSFGIWVFGPGVRN